MSSLSAVNALQARAKILHGIREFFWSRNFLEVETPVVLPCPSQEPYLEPLRTIVHDHRGKAHDGFLRMSPEFSLKKLLASMRGKTSGVAAGGKTSGVDGKTPDVEELAADAEERMPGVFELGPVFRDGEPWGGSHNPEFTMLEWYRTRATYRDLMEDCEQLIIHVIHALGGEIVQRRPRSRKPQAASRKHDSLELEAGSLQLEFQGQRIDLGTPWERLTMREAWKRYAHLDLDEILGARGETSGVQSEKHPMLRSARSTLARICAQRGYTVTKTDTFDDLFFKIHLTEVEPKLGRARPTFLTDWPSQMAALARRKPKNPRYAERVELYIGGLELANGFSELTDADEQLARFRADQRLRRKLGKPVYPIDQDFIAALHHLPPCAGMALGVDRLVMLLTDAATIDEVRWLPASELYR